MAGFLENLFSSGNAGAQEGLDTANNEAMAQNAQGAEVQGVNNVDMSSNGEVGKSAAQNAAVVAGGARSQAEGAAQAAGLSGAAAANAGAGAGANSYGSAYNSAQQNALNASVSERGQTLGANETTAQNKTNASVANTQAQTTERGQNLGYSSNIAQTEQAGTGMIGSTIGAGLSAVGNIISDKREKTKIHDGGDMLREVAKSIRGKQYSYKSSPDQDEYGVMAQDLEKTPLATTVQETPDGTKMVDTRRLTTANTAMIADMARKLDKVFDYIGRVK